MPCYCIVSGYNTSIKAILVVNIAKNTSLKESEQFDLIPKNDVAFNKDSLRRALVVGARFVVLLLRRRLRAG